MIVSLRQELRSLGKHRGGDESPDTWQGAEDLDVTMLTLPRGVAGHRLQHPLDPPETANALRVDQPHPRQQEFDMLADRLHRPGRDRHGRGVQVGEHGVGGEAPDAMGAQEFAEGGTREPLRGGGRWRELEQLPDPGLIRRGREPQDLGIDAVQQIPQAIGEPAFLLVQLRLKPRQLPQPNDQGLVEAHPPEGGLIGGQRGRQDEGIAAIVLGARDGVAVPKAVELLGVESEDGEASLQQRLDHGPARDLDRHRDAVDLAAADLRQPAGQLG